MSNYILGQLERRRSDWAVSVGLDLVAEPAVRAGKSPTLWQALGWRVRAVASRRAHFCSMLSCGERSFFQYDLHLREMIRICEQQRPVFVVLCNPRFFLPVAFHLLLEAFAEGGGTVRAVEVIAERANDARTWPDVEIRLCYLIGHHILLSCISPLPQALRCDAIAMCGTDRKSHHAKCRDTAAV